MRSTGKDCIFVFHGMWIMIVTVKLYYHIRFQYNINYDIRARPYQTRSPTGSKDLQTVNIGLRVLSRPDPNNLPKIYRMLGLNWEERILPSICNEVLKGVVVSCLINNSIVYLWFVPIFSKFRQSLTLLSWSLNANKFLCWFEKVSLIEHWTSMLSWMMW